MRSTGATFPPLPNKQYEIIYCDPPWEYGNKQHAGKGKPHTGGADTHYPVLKLADLKQLPVQDITYPPAALCFMWSSSPHLPQAIDLMRAWGFAYATVAFVWYKQKTNPGNYTMSECELCIVGKHNRIPERRGGRRNERQLISELRGAHSVKPNEARFRIERMFPNHARIELFARQTQTRWDVWGDAVTNV